MTTYAAINIASPTTSGGFSQPDTMAAPVATNSPQVRRSVPIFVSVDEAYYWSFPWQKDVHEAMAARASGESVLFDSDDPDDVVRWLLSVDDDEDLT